ncbi:MAG: twin-arginine translocation pathway signal protein [Rhizobiales bacterium]|nr:twin-arginine translocation pathway signal protein [Rhizobacter sp.]
MTMTMRRRGFMLVLGAGGAVVALTGCDAMPASAVQPWQGPAASETDPRLRALSWAMLAPNPHNLQSWIADIRDPGLIKLQVDTTRLLPETDPPARQVLIGCGAFLELLRMAAAQDGWQAEIVLFPEGEYPSDRVDERPFATVQLRRDVAVKTDPLFAAVSMRRTKRSVYEPRAPGAETMSALRAAAEVPGIAFHATSEAARVARLSELAILGYRTEFGDAAAWGETARVMKLGAPAVAADPSGIALLGTEVWFGRQLGMLAAEKLRRTDGIAATRAVTSSIEAALGTRTWVWLASADNARRSQLAAGRAYLRLDLQAAQSGLAIHPNSQVLQEFSAMDAAYAAFHREVRVAAPARVQMLVRVGYAARPDPAPRRPVTRVVRA